MMPTISALKTCTNDEVKRQGDLLDIACKQLLNMNRKCFSEKWFLSMTCGFQKDKLSIFSCFSLSLFISLQHPLETSQANHEGVIASVMCGAPVRILNPTQ